ncbi:MAG TPA: hypothetical protein VFL95_02460 [Gemmatimonadales bacterium]|nr:hypothetical protein [Gemmatimonadales bacterium]
MRKLAAVSLLILLAACGGDSTGPSKSTVAGTWTFAITSLSGGGLTCSGTGMTMTLAMTGDNLFSGSHTEGTITCSAGGESDTERFASGPILNGTLNGTQVAFDMDDASFHFTGTLNTRDKTMAGTTTAVVESATLTGNWTANYQQPASSVARISGDAVAGGLPSLKAVLSSRE